MDENRTSLVLLETNEKKELIKRHEIPENWNKIKIGRGENNNIRIEDKEIGKNNTEIIKSDLNYYIKDSCSKNGTYIELKKDFKINIIEGMCFDVGSYYLKILEIKNDSLKIGFSRENNFATEKEINYLTGIFENKDKIIFGKNPERSEKSNIIRVSEENELADEHGVFTKNKQNGQIELSALEGEIWFRLEKFNLLPFCKLKQNLKIKLSDKHIFIVKFVHLLCPICDESKNSIYLNCHHSIYCFDCSFKQFEKEKKCKKCHETIESIELIINFPDN